MEVVKERFVFEFDAKARYEDITDEQKVM